MLGTVSSMLLGSRKELVVSLAQKDNGFKVWFVENLKDYASDIAGHGADCGWPYITYTSDCVKLYDQHKEEIWEMLNEDADLEQRTPMELVAMFNRADMADNDSGFKNLLVWYACERIAREVESEEEET